MNKNLLTILLTLLISSQLYAQTAIDSNAKTKINNYYQLAMQYKDGNGVVMDYTKAYNYFTKAAYLGDVQSTYAIGYMCYKGLGCTQDYGRAATLFAQGAALGKDNSMYFYGLCWRNGYGVTKNEDSATYYLSKAAALGYKQATKELLMNVGENSNDSANALVQQINNAAIPDKTTLNQYNKIQQRLPSTEIIAGNYSGYLIQYDWSGGHAVNSKKLQFIITANNDDLSGQWIEDVKDTVAIKASVSMASVLFKNTQYRRKDHYSMDTAILYNFENARLNLVEKGDSVFLAGNIEMFSPERKEPSKPLFVALCRTVLPVQKFTIKTYPNFFSSKLSIDFNLTQAVAVEVQLITLSGTIVYRNPAGILEAGWYCLPIQIERISAGTYLLKLVYGNNSAVVKVIKI